MAQQIHTLFSTINELYGNVGDEKDEAYELLRSIIGERKKINVCTFRKSAIKMQAYMKKYPSKCRHI
jgi:hypothetical protein